MDYYQEEEILGKAYDARLARRLLGYLKPYKRYVAWTLALLVIVKPMMMVGPYFFGKVVDEYAIPGVTEGLLELCLLWLGVLLVGLVIQLGMEYLMGYLGQRIMFDIRVQLFRKLQGLSSSYFDRNPVGRLMTRMMGDVDVLGEMFGAGVVTIFGDLFLLVVIAVFLLFLNLKLALVSLALVPLLAVITFYFRTKVRRNWRDIRLKIARVNANLHENIQGIRAVQLFNREGRNHLRFDKLNSDHLRATLKSVFYAAIFQPLMEVMHFLMICVILIYGGYQVLAGELGIGRLLAFFIYVGFFFQPIRSLAERYNQMQAAMASSERIFKIMDSEEFLPQEKQPVKLSRTISKIEFENACLAYKGDEFVLRDINLTIKRGEKVALVGETGAGKTSIASLLCRFYEASGGRIIIDGRDIRELALTDLRSRIGIVQQDVFLFSGDLAGNITLGNKEIKPAAVQRAAKAVNLTPLLQRLAGGLKSEVQERGANFSTGQKQLVAFARALAYDPEILILDEATANIDTETELLIQDAIGKLMRRRTSLIIAHRLSTIQKCDKIIVMHKGRIVETGTHQQLLRKRGMYYKLYLLQYKDQEVA